MNEAAESETVEASETEWLCSVLEGALLAAGQPLNLNQLNSLFDEGEQPGHGRLREALALLDARLEGRAVQLVEVAGGYRLQVRDALMPVISRLWSEKPPKYSRALLETLAIIAYRQPITRGEIEQIRGVSLSANILKTLQEREWIKVVGHRDLPGKPELLGTTRDFLDYFGLRGLDDLPTLAEIRDLDNLEPELALNDPDVPAPVAMNSDDKDADDERRSETDAPQAPDAHATDLDRNDAAAPDRQSDPPQHPQAPSGQPAAVATAAAAEADDEADEEPDREDRAGT
ncbi:MAG: SMC-Scp complex subunit ScpB [Wenzhouxiangellaceae bacterium]|nr:SMC-Scp complex subunit ScpB [Wenzhouxiangellaceae bacterium]